MPHLSLILPPDLFLSLSNGGNLNKRKKEKERKHNQNQHYQTLSLKSLRFYSKVLNNLNRQNLNRTLNLKTILLKVSIKILTFLGIHYRRGAALHFLFCCTAFSFFSFSFHHSKYWLRRSHFAPLMLGGYAAPLTLGFITSLYL